MLSGSTFKVPCLLFAIWIFHRNSKVSSSIKLDACSQRQCSFTKQWKRSNNIGCIENRIRVSCQDPKIFPWAQACQKGFESLLDLDAANHDQEGLDTSSGQASNMFVWASHTLPSHSVVIATHQDDLSTWRRESSLMYSRCVPKTVLPEPESERSNLNSSVGLVGKTYCSGTVPHHFKQICR